VAKLRQELEKVNQEKKNVCSRLKQANQEKLSFKTEKKELEKEKTELDKHLKLAKAGSDHAKEQNAQLKSKFQRKVISIHFLPLNNM